jgi:tRNA 5-methylaminomethyl-2-thiouridine biosynthesis bifunctional protein
MTAITELARVSSALLQPGNGREAPRSTRFNDIYHAADGAAEVERVFMAPARLAERFATAGKGTMSIAELGFGTALNFAVLTDTFTRCAPTDARLHFISVEKHPIADPDFAALAHQRAADLPVYKALAEHYPARLAGWHRRHFHDGRVTLSLYYGDALDGLTDLRHRMARRVDHWLLDGFAPDRNPDMWSDGLFTAIGQLSAAGATACTFSAAGIVRRGLQRAGFRVRKVDQRPHKRHSTAGYFQEPLRGPLREPVQTFQAPAEVTVIGAGLAGSCTARALAERGIDVRLLNDPASPATNIPAATVNPRLLANGSAEARQRIRSYLFSVHWLGRFRATTRSGVLQLPGGRSTVSRLEALALLHHDMGPWIRAVDAATAASVSSVPLRVGGLLLPGACTVDLGELISELCDHPRISIRGPEPIEAEPEHPQILCTGTATTKFEAAGYLEMLPVWGQLEQVQITGGPTLPLSGDGLITSWNGRYGVGSSYEQSQWQHGRARAFNLDRFESWWADTIDAPLRYKVTGQVRGCRAVTSDRLPIIGSLHEPSGAPLNNLFVSTGHGSHGTISAPFAADCLAAELNGEFSVMDAEENACVSGLRFLHRQARRGLRHGARSPR